LRVGEIPFLGIGCCDLFYDEWYVFVLECTPVTIVTS